MKKNFKFMMIAAAAVAMVGCAKENGGNNTPKAPEDNTVATIAQVSVSQRGLASRAPGGNNEFNATNDETTLNTLSLFVFDKNKQLEQVVEFTSADLAVGADPKSFETTNGLHTMIAIANMPVDMKTATATLVSLKELEDTDPTNDGPIAMYSNFLTVTSTLAWETQATFETAMGISGSTGMLITSVVDGQKTIISGVGDLNNSFDYTFEVPSEGNPTPDANKAVIKLGRAFAKVTADWDNTVQPNQDNFKGQVSKLEFAMLHMPDKSYGIQHVENGIYKAAYHEIGATYTPASYYNWAKSDDATGVVSEDPEIWKEAVGAGSFAYVPENTNPQVEGHRTAMGIRATVKPDVVNEVTLVNGAATGDFVPVTTFTAGSTFYRIKVLRAISGSGFNVSAGWTDVYFKGIPDKAVPAQMAAIRKAIGYTPAQLALPDPKQGEDFEIYAYTNGAAYYYLGLVDDAKTNKYNVGRNEFFWVDIKTINDIGEPSLVEATPEESSPLEVPVNITAEIKVQPWVKVNMDGDI